MRNCVITGGTGFIGSHLSRMLKKDYNIINYDIINGLDIRKPKPVPSTDVIFHLAGILGTPETFTMPQAEIIETNVIGTINMLDIAYDMKAKFLYAGMLRIWHNPYSITKGCAEDYVTMYNKHYELRTTILKLTNVYGPGQRTAPYKKIVPTFVTSALKDEPLYVYGNQTVDLMHVDDAARAFKIMGESRETDGKILEVGSGIETRVIDLAKMIVKMIGSNSEIVKLPHRLGEDPDSRIKIDTTTAWKIAKFRAEIPLKEGLEETIRYYERTQ